MVSGHWSMQDIHEKDLDLDQTNFTQKIYWKMVQQKSPIDSGKTIWENEFQSKIETWENICQCPFTLTPLTELRYFQYRLLSGKLITNYHRSKWDKEISPICKYCDKICTVMHILLECKVMKKIWKAITKWLKGILQIDVQLNAKTIVLNNYVGQSKKAINTILLIVKQCIYASLFT